METWIKRTGNKQPKEVVENNQNDGWETTHPTNKGGNRNY